MFKGFCTTKSSIVSTIVSSDLLEQDLFTYYESLLVRNALNFQAEFFLYYLPLLFRILIFRIIVQQKCWDVQNHLFSSDDTLFVMIRGLTKALFSTIECRGTRGGFGNNII